MKPQFSIYPPEPGDFKVTAPFDFVVEKQALPPGNCIVHREKASNKLQICEDGVICETVETAAIKPPKIPVQPKVVRYGDKHFLRQIWFPDGIGLELSAAPLESEMGRTGVKLEAVYLDADLLCIHMSKGLPPSWY